MVVAHIEGSAAIACTAQIAAEAGHAAGPGHGHRRRAVGGSAARDAERHVGGVDLVNNASDMHLTPRHRAILDLDLAVSDQTMATNLRGTLLCCRQAISLAAVARSSTSGRARRSAVTPRRRPTPRRRRG